MDSFIQDWVQVLKISDEQTKLGIELYNHYAETKKNKYEKRMLTLWPSQQFV